MSRSIWTRCAGDSEIRPLALVAHRVVESQSLVSTRKLVDSDAEQAVLEQLVDDVKPAVPRGARFEGLHYLLATPFRHPPLRHGSRFGPRHERGLFYGSRSLATALAEVAYYRLLFLEHSAAALGLVVTELSTFSVGVRTRRGVVLTRPAFARFESRIHSPTSYADSQAIGTSMREAGVEAFVFRSARDPARGDNIALFEPAFARKKPSGLGAWVCLAERSRVELVRRDPLRPERLAFPRSTFEDSGALPDPGAAPKSPGAEENRRKTARAKRIRPAGSAVAPRKARAPRGRR